MNKQRIFQDYSTKYTFLKASNCFKYIFKRLLTYFVSVSTHGHPFSLRLFSLIIIDVLLKWSESASKVLSQNTRLENSYGTFSTIRKSCSGLFLVVVALLLTEAVSGCRGQVHLSSIARPPDLKVLTIIAVVFGTSINFERGCTT